ncbi:phage protein NinX family protein [Morganella morganii]|uniref:phage protein NinX family protein n=1 Tax=Morganella morganii TaxID=582 RepID=UPI00046AEA26|nr:phage protein NinX family protein [Morganella morganii]
MMRYKEVTDYEINKTVAKYLKLNTIAYDRTEIVLFDDMDATPFDPCNNPADAMPIVIENGISMVRVNNEWSARQFNSYCIEVNDSNYYRAAMEVFLMMKEAENEK